MRTLSVQPISGTIERDVAQLLRSGESREKVISMMRTSGLNKVECMKLLRDHAGISLFEAKKLVHASRAWADRLESDDALHETVFAALKNA